MKLWLLTRGAYSDYSVAGLFSSLENAKKYMARFPNEGYDGYNEPTEIAIDQHIDDTRGIFTVEFDSDGSITGIDQATSPRIGTDPFGVLSAWLYIFRRGFPDSSTRTVYEVKVIADDEDQAKKIGADMFREARALDRLPEPRK